MAKKKLTQPNYEDLKIIKQIEDLLGLELKQKRWTEWEKQCYVINKAGTVVEFGLIDYSLDSEKLQVLLGMLTSLTNLTQLGLRGNELTDISGLGKLTNLTKLILNNNELTDLSSLSKLTKLTELYLGSNQMADISVLKNLPNLTRLILFKNPQTDLSGLDNLPNLTELYLQRNQLTDISCLKKLTNLTVLSLRDNELTDISVLKNLPNLTQLNLGSNQLIDISVLKNLPNLTQLNLGSNQLTDISVLKNLPNLTQLDLDSNPQTDLSGLDKLPNLTQLDLRENQLTDISVLKNLPNLTQLNLQNNKIKELPEWIPQWGIEICHDSESYGTGINLGGNPLETPPLEIVKKGFGAVKSYFEETNKGAEKKYEAKLLILGDGNEGKTCVSRALRGLPFEKQPTTHGVDVEQWPFKYGGKDITLNIWDFEGQEINHQSHQFFLTSQSLYLLVFKCRDQFLMERAEYWLDTIKARAPQSMVAIVISECAGRTPYVPQDKLKAKYKDTLVDGQWLFAVECDGDKVGIPELQKYLMKAAMKLEHMGQKWPDTYARAEKAIEALAENDICYITRKELYKLFDDSGISEEGFGTAAIALATLGAITHFPDCPDLKSFIILKPQWLTKAISLIMEDKRLDEDKGEISDEKMQRLWDDNGYAEMYPTFHNCMKEFELCYDMEDDRHGCLVPLRFGYERPEIIWNLDDSYKRRRIEYKLNIRPPMGIMSRFIVKAHHMIHKTDSYPKGIYWHNGVFLRTGDGEFASEALCEFDNEEKILSIEVRAAFPQNLIEQIHGIAKAVFSFYAGMKPERKYGCIRIDEDSKVEEQCSGFHSERRIYSAIIRERVLDCEFEWHDVNPQQLVFGFSSFGELVTVEGLKRELDKQPQWANQFTSDIMDLMVWVDKNNNLLERIISGQEKLVPEIGQQMELKLHEYLNFIDKMLDDREFNSAPGIILIEPVNGSKWNPKTYFGKEYKVVPFCECKGCKHPVIDAGITFKRNRQWWVKCAPIIAGGTKVLSIGLMAACAGTPLLIGKVGYEAVKYQIAMSKELAKHIELKGGAGNKPDKLTKDVLDAASEGRVGCFDEPVLREQLALFLEEIAPANYKAKRWGTLERRRMPDNSYRWICDECYTKGG
jgi:internalin A